MAKDVASGVYTRDTSEGPWASKPGDSPSADGYLPYYGLTPDRYISGSASGSDNGLTESTPWTWAQMASNATSGMVIGALPGTFTGSNSGDRFAPSFNPPAGVTIACKYAAAYYDDNRTEFRNGVTSGDSGCPTVGVWNRNSVKWYGPYVNEDVSRSSSDTGTSVLWITNGSEIHGAKFDNIQISRSDNHNAIRLEGAVDCVVANNAMSGGGRSGSPDQNHAAITTYSSTGCVIEHNDISNWDAGVFIKGVSGVSPGTLGGITVRYNRVYNCRIYGIALGGANSTSSLPTNYCTQNLVVNTPEGVRTYSYDSVSPSEWRVTNNTFVGTMGRAIGFGTPNGADSFRDFGVNNNLFANVTTAMVFSPDGEMNGTTLGNLTTDMRVDGQTQNYNVAYNTTNWARQNNSNKSRSTWASDSTWDTNSQTISVDPFVDASGGDYRLNSTSGGGAVARVASASGGPVGAFITGDEHIGLEQ